MRCTGCGAYIAQQEEKALSGEVQVVWATISGGEWICDLTGEEHVPMHPVREPGTHIVVEGNPVDGFVFHGIPAFHDHDAALTWAQENCSAEWWVAPLQDVD
jgi:hypothetical protein